MSTWEITSPQRLALDGEVGELEVWLASGKLHVVGTDGPARIEVTKVGSKGVDGDPRGRRAVRAAHGCRRPGGARSGRSGGSRSGRRRYLAEVTIAVPPTARAEPDPDQRLRGRVRAAPGRHRRRDQRLDHPDGAGRHGHAPRPSPARSRRMGVAGELTMETVSGEISLAESSAERVQARTISGSVTCDLDNPFAREVRLDTTSGEITVRVPEDADLDVSLNATSGRVTSAFPQVRHGRRAGHPRRPAAASAPARARSRRTRSPARSRCWPRPRRGRLTTDRPRSRRERGVQPRPAPALPAQAARGGAQARVRADPAAGEPVPRPVRALGRHHLSAAGPDGGRRADHPHRRRRAQGLRHHRRRPGASWPARR